MEQPAKGQAPPSHFQTHSIYTACSIFWDGSLENHKHSNLLTGTWKLQHLKPIALYTSPSQTEFQGPNLHSMRMGTPTIELGEKQTSSSLSVPFSHTYKLPCNSLFRVFQQSTPTNSLRSLASLALFSLSMKTSVLHHLLKAAEQWHFKVSFTCNYKTMKPETVCVQG